LDKVTEATAKIKPTQARNPKSENGTLNGSPDKSVSASSIIEETPASQAFMAPFYGRQARWI